MTAMMGLGGTLLKTARYMNNDGKVRAILGSQFVSNVPTVNVQTATPIWD